MVRETRATRRALLLLALAGTALPAVAQEAATATSGRSYAPADFARFAPRNALDMLRNVPGFAIDAGDTTRRGLGEATGNVLINGVRFNAKSTDIFTELSRISADNVQRIDIVDGATLNVPGLSGQVANIVTVSRGLSGNFAWRPQFRARRTDPLFTNGEVSLSGRIGGTDFTLGLANNGYRNGNAGPEIVFRPDGTIVDRRDEELYIYGDSPRLTGTLKRNFGDGSILNINGSAGIGYTDLDEVSLRTGPDLPDRDRRLAERQRSYSYELGGDYEFGLGGGRLKLIGLHRLSHLRFRQTLNEAFADGRDDEGQRFTQNATETETIARGEYRWRAGGADWQASLEGALNGRRSENGLFALDADGDFVQVPFPDAEALIQERRAEAILTWGRPLSPTLSIQAQAGGEYSELRQSGPNGLTRTFYRPKGFVALAWRPAAGWDLSARLARVVGQLDFSDFAASGNVSAGITNAGNANLVPPQSWDGQVQATRNLGRWGTATARLYGRLIKDIVDIIPIGADGQAPGNLDGTATVLGLQWTSTFNFDPLGWRGAKLDMNLTFQHTSLTDPLTGERRAINEATTREIDINLRHDIPRTNWAWGIGVYDYRQSPLYRLDQRWHSIVRPGNLGVYIERKNLFGLTARFTIDNIVPNNESFRRDFYDGRRPGPVILTEYRDRFSGPIFSISISGTI